MPIDWNEVQNTPGNIPDASVIRGTVAEQITVPSVGSTSAGVAPTGLQAVPPIESGLTDPQLPYTPDYSMWDSAVAGFQDTAIAAMYHTAEAPDFDYDVTFDNNLALTNLEKNYGAQLSDDHKAKLLRTGSKDEFDWQYQRILDSEHNVQVGMQNLGSYLVGGFVDVDLALGGAGKALKLGVLGRAAQRTVRAGAVASTSAAAYTADQYNPMTPEAIALSVSAMTAGSLLLPTVKPKPIKAP